MMSCAKCREWNCVQCGANMADKNSFGLEFAELRASQAQQASVLAELVEALEECLREHGGFTIKGQCERKAREAIAKVKGK